MAKKIITQFVCNSCGYDSTQWLGKCPECGEWNSFKEFKIPKTTSAGKYQPANSLINQGPKKIGEVKNAALERISTTINEFDRILGGIEGKQGIVPGEVVLLSGDPGIGKSTIMLQIALKVASTGKKVLYVSGEESEGQIKIRAERIVNQKELLKSNVLLFASTDIDQAVAFAESEKVDFLIIDSIQTVASNDLDGFPGSLPQIRHATMKLVGFAKATHVPVFFIGHVTKEGTVAGPQLLSHMVDCVLYMEGEELTGTRLLRGLKNRFGDVSEVGIFVMEEKGLIEITNVQDFFPGTAKKNVPGSCITVTLEGSRPLLLEVQALTVPTKLPFPRRVANGISEKRLELLLAVLTRHAKINLDSVDVFVNVVGGMKISETATDLALCLAITSSIKGVPLQSTVAIGEVGLLGETKTVMSLEKRVSEARKFGYKNIITPKTASFITEALKF